MTDEVPLFIRTLYGLLDDCDPTIGRWSDDGSQVVIADPPRFAAEICPKFFRHRNFNSFTRLLNMYQFHKVQGSSKDSKLVCFAHDDFVRGDKSRLARIQRKSATTSTEAREAQPRTGVEALVARDVWEKTNHEIDEMQKRTQHETSTAVSTWMRKVLELEKEVQLLREKNAAMRNLEAERADLFHQLTLQTQLISGLQAGSKAIQDHCQQTNLDPLWLVHHAARQAAAVAPTKDPVADVVQTMGGFDPEVLLATLGLPVAAPTPAPTGGDVQAFLAALGPPFADVPPQIPDAAAAFDADPTFDVLAADFDAANMPV